MLGLPIAIEMPADAGETTREELSFLFGGVVHQLGDALFGLRPVGNDTSDEDRTGPDQLSFAVADPAALDNAAAVLEENGVRHGGIKDIGTGWILEFRDPDNIALELFAPQAG